ncbi:MAG: glutamine--fructose-6-phosphate transaminase (isomerizing), partial [Pseudomonadota bacterium]
MCGIVGVLGKGPVAELLVDALKRLEYRGYDSTGVATVGSAGIERRRAEGKLRNLEALLNAEPLAGDTGIGHTRWATHGKPSEANAHPHMTADVAIVHNGIIENFRELKAELQAEGAAFTSDTDTEVIAHLISREMRDGKDPSTAVHKVLSHLQGAFALAMIFKDYDDLMIAARQGSPLAIGYGDGEMFVGSDAIALAPFTDDIAYLEDGDWAVIKRESVTIHGQDGSIVERTVVKSHAAGLVVDKGNFRHFMAKEIHEQPEVVGHTLAHYIDLSASEVSLPDLPIAFAKMSRLSLSACGTAFYACLVAKYWFERWARLPVDVDIASEFRYREMAMEPGGAALFVSQSGETADTLA